MNSAMNPLREGNPAEGDVLRQKWLSRMLNALGPLLALALVITFFAVADAQQEDGGAFLTQRNFRAIAGSAATVAIAALGMTVIIISGGIDLSAGTAVALCATVLAWCLRADMAAPLALLLAIGTGCATGLVNGVLISSLRVVPFIITLGTMTIYLGIGKIIAEETTVRPNLATQVPAWLSDLLSIRTDALWAGLPMGVWLALVLAGMLAAVLHFTVFGRYVYALGSNEATARLCGIPIARNKIALYTLAGFFIGVAGIYQFSRLSTGSPTSGTGMELRIIAAVVIGGGSLNGGRGSVLGTFAGAAIMEVIRSGCTQLGLDNPIQEIILGVIIIAAVLVDQLRQRRTVN